VQCLDGVSMTTYCTEFRCPSDSDLVALREEALARQHELDQAGVS